MRVLAYVAATAFLVLSGTINVLFAQAIAGDNAEFWIWAALGLASTTFKAAALDTISRHWQTSWTRAAAAGLLLCITVAYDGCAVYGWTRTQAATVESYRTRLDQERSNLVQLVQAWSKLDQQAGPTVVERSRLDQLDQACRTTRTKRGPDCRAVGPQRTKVAIAAHRDKIASQIAAQRQKLATLSTLPDSGKSPRVAALGPLAWLPIVLLELGAVLGWFATRSSPGPSADQTRTKVGPKPDQVHTTPHTVGPKLDQGGPAGPTGGADVDQTAARVVALLDQGAKRPRGVRVDRGRLIGTQRALADALGLSKSTLRRELDRLRAAGWTVVCGPGGTQLAPA